MHSLDVALPPTDRPDPFTEDLTPDDVTLSDRAAADRAEPPRVIEIGEVTAGIAVPEGRGVRFFSSSRDFDGLDGTVFRNTEQAARAARERVAARARSAAHRDPVAELRRRRA
ncbi:hypothetical protein MKK67_10060 [Methylobacterium sp. J-072]|uniref:hypothetical protein n=1 Tax=Methylobacterium sp. J-072 TaxID=2836651 RepID=UPI001FB997A9|nr:hypothetical protein [Methylobacterium sp. J-072]MCJ2092843.1 hypothetical protein [Methylobacterium sp. J-072]